MSCSRFTDIFKTLPHACFITIYVARVAARYGDGNTTMTVILAMPYCIMSMPCLLLFNTTSILSFGQWVLCYLHTHTIQQYIDTETWTRYWFWRVLVKFGLCWTICCSLCASHNATRTQHRVRVCASYILCGVPQDRTIYIVNLYWLWLNKYN